MWLLMKPYMHLCLVEGKMMMVREEEYIRITKNQMKPNLIGLSFVKIIISNEIFFSYN